MSYFIFLKYLDSLEDFRKNPHAKFLLNLLVQNSKALVYSKIQFLFEKELSSDFSPSGPATPVLARFAPQAAGSTLSLFGPSSLSVFAKGLFPSTLRIPTTTPLLSHITAMWALPISFIPFPKPIHLTHVAASSRRLRSPCAARPPTSRCQSKSSLSRLDSPF
jgi:hypothetical protein